MHASLSQIPAHLSPSTLARAPAHPRVRPGLGELLLTQTPAGAVRPDAEIACASVGLVAALAQAAPASAAAVRRGPSPLDHREEVERLPGEVECAAHAIDPRSNGVKGKSSSKSPPPESTTCRAC